MCACCGLSCLMRWPNNRPLDTFLIANPPPHTTDLPPPLTTRSTRCGSTPSPPATWTCCPLLAHRVCCSQRDMCGSHSARRSTQVSTDTHPHLAAWSCPMPLSLVADEFRLAWPSACLQWSAFMQATDRILCSKSGVYICCSFWFCLQLVSIAGHLLVDLFACIYVVAMPCLRRLQLQIPEGCPPWLCEQHAEPC